MVAEVEAISAQVCQPPSAVAIRWLLQRPLVSAVLIGPRTPAQLSDNLRAMDFSLSAEQMIRLTEVSRRELPYPHSVIHAMNARPPV